jgi:hypothetical protein
MVPPANANAEVLTTSRSAEFSPAPTVYLNVSWVVPVPLIYDATPSVVPVSSVRVGVPVTLTVSENVTRISMVAAALYEPSAVIADTLETVGAVVSTIIALFAPREPAAPGEANVSVALFVAASLIVPPFSPNAVVER